VPSSGQSLNADFVWNGEPGSIHVECVPNDDPGFWGCWHSTAEGFAVCTASVDYPAQGYRSMLGWVQLVCSTDNDSAGAEFEIDPWALFGDAPTPYCWYGQRPTLFDAPARPFRQPLEWTAHSFLAATPLNEVADLQPRRVVPIIGFSWGFADSGSEVLLYEVALLPKEAWESHVKVLSQNHPLWVISHFE
jgi:hypothetical protein